LNISINFVEGKDVETFNVFVKENYDNAASILHGVENVVRISFNKELSELQIQEIVNFYESLPVFDEIDLAKVDLKSKINELRDFKTIDCFEHEINGVSYRFDCDDRSAIRLTSLVTGATHHLQLGNEFSQVWRTKDNQNLILDANEAIALFASARNHESDTVFKAVYIKEMIDATNYENVEQIQQIDVNALWDSTQWPQE